MPRFQLDQTFFGFKPKDRSLFHENLFELIWHGNGRWTFNDIYHMPIPMRKFWAHKLTEKLSKNSGAAATRPPNTPIIAKPPM